MSEETAMKLEHLAEDCIQAAREAVAEPRPEMFPVLSGNRRTTA